MTRFHASVFGGSVLALGLAGLTGCGQKAPTSDVIPINSILDPNGGAAANAPPLVDPNLISGNGSTDESPPIPPSGIAVVKLNTASSVRPSMTIDTKAKIPTAVQVNVPVPDPSTGDPVEMSLSYFDEYKDFYNLIEPASQLYPIRYAEDSDGRHIFFGQQRDGLVVFGAELAIHLNGDRVLGTNGRYLPSVPRVLTPKLDGPAAQEAAAAFAGTDGSAAEGVPMQVFFNEWLVGGPDKGTHQAWRIGLRGDCGSPTGCALKQYFIDAFTGELLWTLNLSHTCDKHFDIETVNETESTSCWSNLFETSDDQWFDENGVYCFLWDCANPDPEGFNAYNYAHKTYDYYAATFGRCGWDSYNGSVTAMIHARLRDSAGNIALNAKYDNGCNHLVFSSGMVTLDVFAHEFTHGVTRATSALVYANQSGALNESYSDVFGAMVNGGWLIGQGCALGTLRDMSNPPGFGQPDKLANYVNTTADNGGVHTNSGIPNKAAYLIADGGTFNGVTVYRIGRYKLQQLYYNVLTSRLTSNAQFIDARNATVNLAREWAQNGHKFDFTMSDVGTVIRAWNAVGVGAADTDGDGWDDNEDSDDDGDHIPDAIDNCPKIQNPYQEDTDHDGQGDACDTDIDNDGIANSKDNCVFTANPAQTDTDGDGVGDACDNCPNTVELFPRPGGGFRTFANPDQTDTDDDGQGDICDDDDDGDGVPDISDNCPLAPNASQTDLDKNGIGLACDQHEQQIFTQPDSPDPKDWFKIKMCAGGCPDWLTNQYLTHVNVELPWNATVQIVDQYGVVAAKAKLGTSNNESTNLWSFELRPGTGLRYAFPTRASKFVHGLPYDGQRQVLESTQYYLRVVGYDGNHNPISVAPVSVNVGPLAPQ